MRIRLEGAWIDVENAFAYRGQTLRIARRSGDDEAVDRLRLNANSQFSAEIDRFADCILTGRIPRTPGGEGLQDHLVMEALYRSARTRQPIALPEVAGLDAFRGPPLPAWVRARC